MDKGIYNIYKPKGPTSYDIIRMIKRDAVDKKVGHAGTLDPLASGVLVVAIGREYTKQLDVIVKGDKEYIATIKLGFSSITQDEEGEKTAYKVEKIPIEEDIKNILLEFMGEIKQIPPIYSALKIEGQPAYKLARAGKTVELKERGVTIHKIELLEYTWPKIKIRVSCSSGTYIRTLANDTGAILKTGGYLSDLIRTKVGKFRIEDSINLEK